MSLWKSEIYIDVYQKSGNILDVEPVRTLSFKGYRKAKREALKIIRDSSNKCDTVDFYHENSKQFHTITEKSLSKEHGEAGNETGFQMKPITEPSELYKVEMWLVELQVYYETEAVLQPPDVRGNYLEKAAEIKQYLAERLTD